MQEAPSKNFAILRTQKVKGIAELSGRSRHNARTTGAGVEHATSANPRFGGGVYLLAGSDDALSEWRKKLDERGVDPMALRKDSVKAVEMVFTASGDWFDTATCDSRAEWVRRSLAFANKKFGAENILSAHLHDDEETPHLHILAAPLVFKSRARRGRARKGREGGNKAKPLPTWGLSAKEFIGGSSAQHTAMQTQYWECVADLGLRRGLPRKESGARNLAPAKWRALQAYENDRAVSINQSAESCREEAAQTLVRAKAAVEALTLGLSAIAQGELIYRQGHKRSALGSLRVLRNIDHPLLPQSTNGLARWHKAVRPYWSALVGVAKRFARIADREKDAECLLDRMTVEREAHLRVAARQARFERKSGLRSGPAWEDMQIIERAKLRGERQR